MDKAVRLKGDPGRVGVLTGGVRERAGLKLVQVLFPEGAQYVPEDQIDLMREVKRIFDPAGIMNPGKVL